MTQLEWIVRGLVERQLAEIGEEGWPERDDWKCGVRALPEEHIVRLRMRKLVRIVRELSRTGSRGLLGKGWC